MSKNLHIGPLSSKSKGQHAKFEKVRFELPQRIAAGTTTGHYVPSAWPVRAGADDHKQHRSKGIDA
jgi:hypothetical protein